MFIILALDIAKHFMIAFTKDMHKGGDSRMRWCGLFIEILEAEYQKLHNKNPRISRRGYARLAGVSASTMFRLLAHDLTITADRALEMLDKLSVSSETKNNLIKLMNYDLCSQEESTDENLLDNVIVLKIPKDQIDLCRQEIQSLGTRLKAMSCDSGDDVEIKIGLIRNG